MVWIAAVVSIGVVVVAGFAMLPQKWNPWHGAQDVSSDDAGSSASIDAAEAALARGDTQQALALAAQTVAQDSSDAQVDNRAGNVALRASDTAAAERDYTLGEAADRRNPWNFVALGQLYARENKLSEADAQLRAALSLAPKTNFLHYDLAVVELQEGLGAAALADFNAELTQNPTYAPAATGRTEALARMGQRIVAAAVNGAPHKRANGSTQKGRPSARPNTNKAPKVNLALQEIAAPSPSPRAASTNKVVAVAPTATPSPTPQATVAPSPKPTARPHQALALAQPKAQIIASAPQVQARHPASVTLSPPSHPAPLTDLASDARGYLQGVTSDLNFTHVLPGANSDEPTEAMQSRLNALTRSRGSAEELLRLGAGALESGRLSLAASAFAAASDQAPRDWRGPYFSGLAAQARGDEAHARIAFLEAANRSARPEPFTSLAIVDMEDGDVGAAFTDAKRAAALDPSYEPGRFVAGMLALMNANVPAAERHLAAAVALGGAPVRTQAFLTAVYRREGDTAQAGSNGY